MPRPTEVPLSPVEFARQRAQEARRAADALEFEFQKQDQEGAAPEQLNATAGRLLEARGAAFAAQAALERYFAARRMKDAHIREQLRALRGEPPKARA